MATRLSTLDDSTIDVASEGHFVTVSIVSLPESGPLASGLAIFAVARVGPQRQQLQGSR